jgi:predicted esterase
VTHPRLAATGGFVLAASFALACTSDPSLPSSSSGSGGPSGANSSDGGASSSDGGASSSDGGASSGEPGSLVAGKSTRTFDVAGREREVIVVVPPQVSSGKIPLVIALHGNGDTSANFVATSTLESLAAARGFVLAAPQGISQSITIGQQTLQVSWDAYRTTAEGNIDLPLLDAVREELLASGSIDEARVSTYGYSQGGYFSFRYGIERSAALACAAVLAAANPLGPQLTAQAARKIAFSLQIGTGDFAITQARSTRDDLEQKSFPLDYREIEGAGHVPIPGDPAVPLDDCLGRSLP